MRGRRSKPRSPTSPPAARPQALPALSTLSARYPDSPIFASTYARALASTGRTRDALARFRAAVKQWPGDWSLYHELAVVARDLGEADEARRAEDAALALRPDEPSALNGRGLLLADAGRHDEAARAFEQATRQDPTNGVYLANLGNARRALGDLDGAAAAYQTALDRAPTSAMPPTGSASCSSSSSGRPTPCRGSSARRRTRPSSKRS